MLVSIKSNANYLVNEDENKNTIILESDVKPSFYNETDVLKCMTSINRYLTYLLSFQLDVHLVISVRINNMI